MNKRILGLYKYAMLSPQVKLNRWEKMITDRLLLTSTGLQATIRSIQQDLRSLDLKVNSL